MALTSTDSPGGSWRAADRAGRIAVNDRAWATYHATLAKGLAEGAALQELIHDYDRVCGRYQGVVLAPVAEQIPRLDLGPFAGLPAPYRVSVREGRYRLQPDAPCQDALFALITDSIDDEVDCVVEFGSGMGFNLARLRARRPDADVTYIACEPTASGREATRRIFQTDPRARVEIRAFDYADDDLAFLGRFRRVVAFTCHSVEQVPVLGEAFYRRLLASNVARCIHIEPVGWQRFTDIASFVHQAHDPGPARRRLNDDYVFVLDDARLVDNAAAWSALCRYNTDLLRLVSAAAARGEVELCALAYDVIGVNPFNPSTVVAWKR